MPDIFFVGNYVFAMLLSKKKALRKTSKTQRPVRILANWGSVY